MIRKIIIGFLILFPFLGFSQGEHNIWYFGNRAGLDFNSGSQVVLNNCAANFMTMRHNFVQCDSLGNLLFYADDDRVFDRNHNLMPNGIAPAGYARGTQGTFAVRDQVNKDLFYFFTMDGYYGSNSHGLSLNLIDMKLNGGMGAIISDQFHLPVYGGSHAANVLTGIRHKNNKDTWIVVKESWYSKHYLSYLITENGLDTIPVISEGSFVNNNISNHATELRISPDGEKLVLMTDSIMEFCHFNISSGTVTPYFIFLVGIGGGGSGQGIEFSHDSKYLYIHKDQSGSGTNGTVYQYDANLTDSAAFKQSETFIAFNHVFSGMMMGPDRKIYLTEEMADSLSIIHNPTASGAACNFQRNAICLEGHITYYGLPQFLQTYYLKVFSSDTCDGIPVSFSTQIWPPMDSIHWDFGDPASGPNNISLLQNPVHQYSGPGIYNVSVFVRHNDLRTDTITHQVKVFPTPDPDLGTDKTICIGESWTFNAGSCAGCSFIWKNVTTGITVGTGQTFTTDQPGIYSVLVTGLGNCTGADTAQLTTSNVPIITNAQLSKSICSGEPTDIQLTSNVAGTLFYWTANLTSGNITGFSADSGLMINQILINHLSIPGIVTYHVVPKVGNCSGDTTDFVVTVNPGDSVKVSISASANNICEGTPATFTATPTNPGTTPVYQWKVNGNNSGTSNPVFTYAPLNGDQIWCVLTSSITTCVSNNPAISDTITMIVNPNLPVSVSVSASENPVCEGTLVTFTATPTNGGANPAYQWKVNGSNVGTNSPVFTYVPLTNDNVQCILTSSEICTSNNPASSNQVSMIVNPNLQVSVSVTASANPVCEGTQVTFMATPTNGGSNPSFQWQVNGTNAGTNSPTYTYIPVTGDEVTCDMTSSEACTSNNPASSIPYPVSVIASPYVAFTRCFDSITTTGAKPIKLKGGIPLGGIYSGPGVVSGYFYPNMAGIGNHTITYTYPAAGLCSAQESVTIVTRNAFPFTCSNQITDPRDGKVYSTVQIGTQCWMAENLNYGYPIDESTNQRDNCIPEKYSRNSSFVIRNSYYQWDELMGYDDTPGQQGLCPPGWHVPTESDWHQLFSNWENSAFAGSPLKATGFSGFNAENAGGIFLGGAWNFSDLAVFFWSSTLYGTTKAWAHGMNDYDPSVSHYPAIRASALSVRCVKD